MSFWLGAARRAARKMISLEAARARKATFDWAQVDIPTPEFLGNKVLPTVPLAEIIPFIDWAPFFSAWELHGRFPQILEDPLVGEEARKLYADAKTMLARIEAEQRFTASATIGFFPVNSVGDDIEVYSDVQRSKVIARLCMLRQQAEKQSDQFNLCLSDYLAPKDSGRIDYLGGFAVTAGHGVEQFAAELRAKLDDYSAIMAQALGDRLAEALAEAMHKRGRDFCGYGRSEKFTNQELIRENYRGIRPAPGYPANPDHTEKTTLFALLDATTNAGITLTESMAMLPASSVSGLYFNHPEAKYFGIGKIGRDQVEDYAMRKGMTLEECERWLGPNLDYDPAPRAAAKSAA